MIQVKEPAHGKMPVIAHEHGVHPVGLERGPVGVPVLGTFSHSVDMVHPIKAHAPVPAEQATPFAAPPAPVRAGSSPPPDNDQDTDEETGVIRCICSCDDDDGFTIQCERCMVWQHCACFGMSQSSVPDEYLCEQCDPRPVNVEYARAHQRRRLENEARKLSSSAAAAARPPSPEATTPAAHRRRSSQGGSRHQRSPSAPRASPEAVATPPTSAKAKSSARRRPSRSARKTPTGDASARSASREADAEFFDRLEAWQIEFTHTRTNTVRDPAMLPQLAQFLVQQRARSPLRTHTSTQGLSLAPLASDAVHNGTDEEDDDGVWYAPHGLAALGDECTPVELQGSALEDLAARTHVRSISDQVVSNFFSNVLHLQPVASKPQRIWSASKTFCRPVMHGLFADQRIPAGAFIRPYYGELQNADRYRADPLNQYARLGCAKPHVCLLPPPLNVALDARVYGCEARFVRSSCHPNAVLRPILLRNEDGAEPRLQFGLFAIAPIPRSHEVTVGWDWDDAHIVHLLPELAKRPWNADPIPPPHASPAERRRHAVLSQQAFEQRGEFPYAGTVLADKMNAVVSAILSVSTCGCVGPSLGGSSTHASHYRRQNCAVTQMLRIGQGMPLLQPPPPAKNGTKPKPLDFGPLAGAVRRWYPDSAVCRDAEGVMRADEHLRARIAQDAGFVKRVVPGEDTAAAAALAEHAAHDSDGESDASAATEALPDRVYSSDEEERKDPLLSHALQQIKREEEGRRLSCRSRSVRDARGSRPVRRARTRRDRRRRPHSSPLPLPRRRHRRHGSRGPSPRRRCRTGGRLPSSSAR